MQVCGSVYMLAQIVHLSCSDSDKQWQWVAEQQQSRENSKFSKGLKINKCYCYDIVLMLKFQEKSEFTRVRNSTAQSRSS